MKKILLLSLASFFLSFTFYKGDDKYLKLTSEEAGAIPPDFGKNKEAVLIVIKLDGETHYDKRLAECIAEYKGEYVYMTYKEHFKVDESPYADKVKYPYTLVSTVRAINPELMHYDHYIYDRANKTKYIVDSHKTYSKILRAYFINLEKKRNSWK